jgi:seryl-tRNA synthetase
MHDIKWIRDNPEAFDRGLARRGLPGEALRLLEIDERRRGIIQRVEAAQARRNAASKEIGQAKARKDEARAAALLAEVADFKASIMSMEAEEKQITKELEDALARIPNLPLDDVPDGVDERDNRKRHKFGEKRHLAFEARQHFDLGEALGLMDFQAAAKLSGARFVVLKNGLARLERALAQFMLDLHTTEHGYSEVAPPLLVRDEIMFGTAQLPKFMQDQFLAITQTLPAEVKSELLHEQAELIASADYSTKSDAAAETMIEITKRAIEQSNVDAESKLAISIFLDDFLMSERSAEKRLAALQPISLAMEAVLQDARWLIPTAEVPLTNLVRESIIDEAELPLRLTACTPCFRAEAGAAGKDTRGMIRQHQFTKVELVSITTPEASRDEHERMLSCAEEVLRRLGLHYRVVTLCTGDMGFASQKTYDIEVWLPGQGAYREISSCSVCGDFQARRMAARYRSKEGRAVRHVHTLNGSGVAVGRALIAVMETYQQDGGSIAVPDALQGYMGGQKLIARK